MTKLILTTPASFVSDASAVSQETVNNAAIAAAVENTLSRDGTGPNQMLAQLDMNSNRILNLPPPGSGLEPVRLIDVNTATTMAGAMAKVNNLSDVASISGAKVNLALDQVNNTSDANKPLSTADTTALALKANLASPTFTGTPAAPTPTAGDNSTKLATTAFVLANAPSVTYSTAPAHKFSTGITSGVIQYAQPDAVDVTFTAPNGGIQRTINARLVESAYNVIDYGADPTGVADSAPAFRAAIAAVPYGGKILVPAGNYLLNSLDPSNNVHVLDFSNFPNKVITIEGVGWDLRVGGVYTNPQGSILRIGASIPTTADLFYIPSTDRVTGFRLKDFAVVTTLGVFNNAHGRNGVHIDTTAGTTGYHEFFQMENVFIDNMANGYSIYVQGQTGGNTMIDSVIDKCVFMNSRFENIADNVTVQNCVFGANAFGTTNGPNIGMYVSQVAGATSFRSLNNNFVNQDGMIIIDSALTPIIRDCEFEQNPGANAHGSMVDLAGAIGVGVVGAVVTGCAFSNNSTTGTIPNIKLGATTSAQVYSNTLRQPNSQFHISIGGASQRARIGDNPSYTAGTVGDTSISDSGSQTYIENTQKVWTTYVPTVTASSGTFTTVTATGAYRVLGKLLIFEQDVTIATVGTGAGSVQVSLPAGYVAKRNSCASGREFAVNGFMLNASIGAGGGSTSITKYDNTSIIAAGVELVICGVIEIN